MQRVTRVLLADDHKIVRDGLRSLVGCKPGFEIVGEAEDGPSAVRMATELQPDVVVMDITMPGMSGIEATRGILSEHPATRVVALSMHSEPRLVAEMLKAGASAYLMKDSAFEELEIAIETVASGKTYLSQGVASVVVEDYLKRLSGDETDPSTLSALSKLSKREREVLQLTAEGLSTKEVAARLELSIKTVDTHRRQVMEKLGIFNLAGLVKFAIREGLVPIE